MTAPRESMLNCDAVEFSYGTTPVLSQMSLSVDVGEVFGLLGPNGSGKSTLIRLISGVLVPQQGHITLAGREVQTYSREELARLVAVVPQETTIELPFSALEVVLMGRTPHMGRFSFEQRHDLAIAKQAMRHTGVDTLAEREIHTLSGGERQRVMLARALAQEPQILLLDEPTAFLDIRHQVEVYDLIKQLSRTRNLAVLATMHDLNLAAMYCDRLALLKNGTVFAGGTPETVLTYVNLKAVYETEVYIGLNDITGKVHILPLDAASRRRLAQEDAYRS